MRYPRLSLPHPNTHGRWRSKIAITAVALVATACADSSTESPTALAPVGVSMAQGGGSDKPDLIPASVKYSDTSKPNATGRAGSATMTARALLGKDGETTLEVTTGALDTGDPGPGNLRKLQIKAIVDPDMDPMFTENHNGMKAGGYWAGTYKGVARGVVMQVQGNIDGIDRNRTGVVTVQEMVKLRPDLEATITAPAQAEVNNAVSVSGTVAELNGDVGATAHCVLYVDAVETDRADGIWVNNGSAVTCAFTLGFDVAGTYELTFAVEDVVPGDYDTANNTDAATIEIVEPQPDLRGYMHAYDQTGHHTWAWTYQGNFPELNWVDKHSGRWQGVWIYAWQPWGEAPKFADATSVDITESTDGSALYSTSVQLHDDYWWYCSYGSNANGNYAWVCPTYFHSGRHANDVTYYSSNYGFWTGSEITVYEWNYSYDYEWGQLIDWGSDVTLDVTVHTPSGSHSLDRTVQLNDYKYDYAGSDCDYYWYYSCYAWDTDLDVRAGWTWF